MSRYLDIAEQVLREIGYQSGKASRYELNKIHEQSLDRPTFDLPTNKKSLGPTIFEYFLDGDPRPLVMISRPRTDLKTARRRLEHRFGCRLSEVRPYNPMGGRK